MATQLCDTCKSATAALFCRLDSAFLCLNCDSRIHVAPRHARVSLCEVCEQAPAHVTCKADAAALCVTCDRDIHSANPLAHRHERVPVTPFCDSVFKRAGAGAVNILDDCCFSNLDGDGDGDAEEEEAASWLLPTATAETTGDSPEMNTGQFSLLSDSDLYVDLDCGLVDPKMEAGEQNSSASDGVVPVESSGGGFHIPMVNENFCFDLDFSSTKAYPYGFNCINQSVSSSSLEVGVVPDCVSTAADIPSTYGGEAAGSQQAAAVQLSPAEREARVMRYREKRKNLKFEKKIRYASRKAYAEMRPRIKGRFAKRSDVAVDADRNCNPDHDCDRRGFYSGFGVVPTF